MSVMVLPLPATASTRIGPPRWSTTRRCSGLRLGAVVAIVFLAHKPARRARPDPGADHVEFHPLDGLFVGHAVPIHQDRDSLVVVVDGDVWLAAATRVADER